MKTRIKAKLGPTIKINEYQHYIAALCVHYFDALFSQIDTDKQCFILDKWSDIAEYEDQTKPCISIDLFMKKYKIRLKLVQP